MTNQESSNVKLSVEQLLQIDAFQKTLANLQSEIDIHSKNLQISRNDSVRLGKEVLYLEGVVKGLGETRKSLEETNERLSNSVAEHQANLSTITAEYSKVKSDISNALVELEQQKKDFSDKEAILNSDREELSRKMANISEQQSSLENKHKILSEALNSTK